MNWRQFALECPEVESYARASTSTSRWRLSLQRSAARCLRCRSKLGRLGWHGGQPEVLLGITVFTAAHGIPRGLPVSLVSLAIRILQYLVQDRPDRVRVHPSLSVVLMVRVHSFSLRSECSYLRLECVSTAGGLPLHPAPCLESPFSC